jgi:L1 cell adhesion molecule like protein
MAGLNCIRLLNAPTAAGIAHWIEQHHEDDYTTLVLDIGASRAEATVLQVFNGIFEVRSGAADTLLGGRAYDERLLHCLSLRETSGCQDGCLDACESLKVSLSTDESGQLGCDLPVTREQFEDICWDLFRATVALVERALRDAKYSKLGITEVVMTGGSVQMPMLQKVISDFFDRPCTVIRNPEMASVRGSALYAAASFSPGSIAAMLVIDMKPSSVHLEIPSCPLVQLYPHNVVTGNKTTANVVFIPGMKLPRYLRLIEKDVIPTLIGIFDLTLLASESEMSRGLVLQITADVDMDGIIEASVAPVSPDFDADFRLPIKKQTTLISEKSLLQSCISFLKVLTNNFASPLQQDPLQAVISQTELELYNSPQDYEKESLALCSLFQ